MRKAEIKRLRKERRLRAQSSKLKENAWSSGVIYYTFDPPRSIWVYPSDINNLRHFIVFNSTSYLYATKAARISCHASEYIECNDDGRISWILNKEEKEWLVSVLTPEKWRYLLYEYYYNKYADEPDEDYYIPMPDYMQLPEK